MLSSLSKVSILGDFTTWYESVGLDSVALVNTKGASPATQHVTIHLMTIMDNASIAGHESFIVPVQRPSEYYGCTLELHLNIHLHNLFSGTD